MKVLLLASKPFLPVRDGGNEASRALAKELLHANFQVKALTFSSEKHPFQPELFADEEWKNLQIEHFPIRLKVNPFLALWDLIRGRSYNLTRFNSEAWRKRFIAILEEDIFDIILFDSLFSAEEVERIKKAAPTSKLFLRAHNVESNIWYEKAHKEVLLSKKKYLTVLAKQLAKREKEILAQVDRIFAISSEDLFTFKSWGYENAVLLPYFPEVNEFYYDNHKNDVFFIGSMDWQPNIEAHNLLVQKIFPTLMTSFPELILRFGGAKQNLIKKAHSKLIEYHGFVKNKEEFMVRSGILLAPIQSGSGVRIKIIEALSMGVPVVTTTKGAEGIPLENSEGIFIAKNDTEFVQMASELIQNHELRKETSEKAMANYTSWKNEYDLKRIFESNGK